MPRSAIPPKVRVIFELYIDDVTKMGHPSLADWTVEEIKARFWRDYPMFLG
jgi:hypothetical protein